MPGLRSYTEGQQVTLLATVVDAHDASKPVVSIGGHHTALDLVHLDAADTNPDRPLTQEELDREEQAVAKVEPEGDGNVNQPPAPVQTEIDEPADGASGGSEAI